MVCLRAMVWVRVRVRVEVRVRVTVRVAVRVTVRVTVRKPLGSALLRREWGSSNARRATPGRSRREHPKNKG